MYNGVGLLTPRGSGTSGHVQSNSFNVRPNSAVPAFGAETKAPIVYKPNEDILEHNRKREIEVKLVELEEELEEKGCDPLCVLAQDRDVQARVATFRGHVAVQRSRQ